MAWTLVPVGSATCCQILASRLSALQLSLALVRGSRPVWSLGPWFVLLAFVIAPSTGRFSFGGDMSSILPEETV